MKATSFNKQWKVDRIEKRKSNTSGHGQAKQHPRYK